MQFMCDKKKYHGEVIVNFPRIKQHFLIIVNAQLSILLAIVMIGLFPILKIKLLIIRQTWTKSMWHFTWCICKYLRLYCDLRRWCTYDKGKSYGCYVVKLAPLSCIAHKYYIDFLITCKVFYEFISLSCKRYMGKLAHKHCCQKSCEKYCLATTCGSYVLVLKWMKLVNIYSCTNKSHK